MSWWGVHPVISKMEARSRLPPAACKICVYWERCELWKRNDQWYPHTDKCNRCASVKSVRHAPFTEYQSDLSRILGACEQGGRYLWSIDLPCPLALLGLIQRKVVQFKEQIGNLAVYVPIVKAFWRFRFDGTI